MKQRHTQMSREFLEIVRNPLFDQEWYAREYPEAKDAEGAALHFLKYGREYSLRAGPLFDSGQYMQIVEELEGPNQSPLVHFLRSQAKEPNSFALAKHLLEMP